MRRLASTGAVLAVLCCVGAAVATSALAAPPEFTPPFPKPFHSESGPSLLETVGGAKLACASDMNFGEMKTPTEGTVTIVFKGCKLTIPGAILPCNTEGAAPEEIVTKLLATKLGYIAHTPLKTVVGLEVGFGEAPVAFIECGGLKVLVAGSFIGKITPIKKFVKPFPAGHFTLVFTQAKGHQKPKKFEGLAPDFFGTKFGGGAFEESGFADKDAVGFPEAVMIIA